jgi:hypothetical protein
MSDARSQLPQSAASGDPGDAPARQQATASISVEDKQGPSPMLDVNPVHPVRGWRDFVIHIATIVVGLLIAIGLEQAVEFLHHSHELADTRRALRLEREENYKTLTAQTIAWRREIAELQNNLLVLQYLQQHPGTPQEKLPGVLLWRFSSLQFATAVWDAAHASGVVALMPREEIEDNTELYIFLRNEVDASLQTALAINQAQRYNLMDSDPSHLSPAEVATEIDLTQAAMTKLFLHGALLGNLSEAFPDFPSTVTRAELGSIRHTPDAHTAEILAPARALTEGRLKAAAVDQDAASPQK